MFASISANDWEKHSLRFNIEWIHAQPWFLMKLEITGISV
jgi:hypothetical protein